MASSLDKLSHHELDAPGAWRGDYTAGDLAGDAAFELVGVDGDALTVWDDEGTEVAARDLPDGVQWGLGFLADVDGDGGNDVVLGSQGGSAAQLLVVTAQGRTILRDSVADLPAAQTVPHTFLDGRIVYSVTHGARVKPSRIGAYDVAAGRNDWQRTHPLAISAITVGGEHGGTASGDASVLLAVSSLAVGPGTMDESDGFPHLVRGRATLISADGSGVYTVPVGSAGTPGYPGRNAVSAVDVRIVRRRGDHARFVVVEERMSELYQGETELTIQDTAGEIYAQTELPGATPVSVGMIEGAGPDGAAAIVAVSAQYGTVDLLDQALHRLRSWQSPRGPHVTALQVVEDVDGDGEVEIVVSENHRLYVLSTGLAVEYSTAFPGPVEQVLPLRDPDVPSGVGAVAVVHGDGVTLLRPADESTGTLQLWVNPAGARVRVAGRSLPRNRPPIVTGLTPGSYTVEVMDPDGTVRESEHLVRSGRVTTAVVGRDVLPPAEREQQDRFAPDRVVDATPAVPLRGGDELTIHAEAALPEEPYPWFRADTWGGPEQEILFDPVQPPGTNRLVSHDLRVLRGFPSPLDRPTMTPIGDVDGDGKNDIAFFGENSTFLEVYRADGLRVLRKAVAHGHGTRLEFRNWVNDMAAVVTFTYEGLHPSGVYFLSRDLSAIEEFYPLTGIHPGTWIVPHGDYLVIPELALEWPVKVRHADGTVVSDSDLILHFLNRDGTPAFISEPIGTPGEHRSLFAKSLDLDGDGRNTLYLQIRTRIDGNAPSILAEWDDRARRVKPLYRTAPGASLTLRAYEVGGRPVALLRTGTYGERAPLIEIDPDGAPRRRLPIPGGVGGRYVPGDIDADGVLDVAYTTDDGLYIRNADGEVLRSVPFDGETRIVRSGDIRADGTLQFLIERADNTYVLIGY